MSVKFAVAISIALVAGAECPSDAAPVYSQVSPGEPSGAFGSQDTHSGQKIADNFVLNGSGSIVVRSIRFVGGYGLRNPPPITPSLDELPPDEFRITFFEDSGGEPGQPLAGGDFFASSAYLRSPRGGNLLNGVYEPIDYLLNLSGGISLSRGMPYWVSITNDAGPDHGWLWARGDGVIDHLTAATFDDVLEGPWSLSVGGGMFFELNDTNVPEPMSFASVLITLFFFLASRTERLQNVCSDYRLVPSLAPCPRSQWHARTV